VSEQACDARRPKPKVAKPHPHSTSDRVLRFDASLSRNDSDRVFGLAVG